MPKNGNSQFKPSPSVWDVAPPRESLELAKWSADHFQRHGRPLRLAIDAHYWQVHFENDLKVDWLRKNSREVNAVEKIFMYQTMTLLELSIHIVFVFDGPDRYNRFDHISKPSKPESIRLLKDLLNHLGVPFHQAPAEAAPTCVKLQQLGVVDAVWTNHSVALTWGCQDIVLFKKQERKWKGTGISNESVTKHDALALLQKCDLDHPSLVLELLLGGSEYSRGLPGVNHETALEIAQNAKQLAGMMCDVFSDNADRLERNKWQARFRAFLKDNGYHSVTIPNNFPDPKAIDRYRNPPVRPEETLRNLLCLRHGWTRSLSDNLADICQFLNRNFHSYPSIKWPIRHLTGLELNHKLLEGSLRDTPNAYEGIKIPATLGDSLRCNVTVSSIVLLPGFAKIYDMWSTHEVKCSVLSCVVRKGLPPERLPCPRSQGKGSAKQKRKIAEPGPEETTKQNKKSKVPSVRTPHEATQLLQATPKSGNTQDEKAASSTWQFRIPPLPQDLAFSQPRQSPIDTLSSSLELYDLLSQE